MLLNKLFLPTVFIFFLSCKHESKKLFTEVTSSHSNIDFANAIKEDENYNILTYEYLYNGGGVAVGDINNDGLADIMFTGNMTPNKLYLNKGNFEFEDITENARVSGRPKWKTGTVMADVNGDGFLDIYVCYSGPGTDAERANELYINNGPSASGQGAQRADKVAGRGVVTFTESAKQYGLDAPGTYTTTVSFFDMDNDGDLDMFMVNHADMFYNPFFNTEKLRSVRNPKFGNRLYRNDNNHFTDISDQAHINGSGLNFGLSVSVSDINSDGWSDIYVTNDYDERDFLYLNNHDGTFREVLAKAAGHISEFAMGSEIADYNNDNKPDVVVLDMLPEDNHRQKLLKGADTYDKYTMRVNAGFGNQQMRNTLQLNNGTDTNGIPQFSEVGQLAGMSNTDWSWSPLLADFDNDGWKDLFISNGILRDMTNLDFVKYTSGYSADYTAKTGDKGEMWQLVKDMPSTKLTNYLFKNNHDLTFRNVGTDWGFTKKAISNGSAYADLDNDGDLDLIINQLNDKATVYQNNSTAISHSHYLRLQLKGDNKNTAGIGAKVYVQTASSQQMQEQYTSRGFQSSVDPVMHIGLGTDTIIQSIKVKWPGGKISLLKNIQADTLLVINQSTATAIDDDDAVEKQLLFTDITLSSGIHFTDTASQFVDFKISPLLPYQLSKPGPSLAKADVNGDGLEDLFIGGSSSHQSRLYIQSKDENFSLSSSQPWNSNKNITVTGAWFFDADRDGDADLYLVSGGADYYLNNKNYQDEIYENDGHGNFKKLNDALPAETISGSCVRAADYNNDGLTDLFVGSKINPGLFPSAPESLILQNISKPGHIQFQKDVQQKPLSHPGMVTDAAWADLNKDGWQDLVVVGEFMPITVFINNKGSFTDETNAYGLRNTNGLWCRILADDFDSDGDIDFIIGNVGTNTQLKASATEPLSITYSDFYGNGVVDPILCYYSKGKSYPYLTKDEMADQVPSIQKKFLKYADYADAQLTDIFTSEQLAKAKTIEANTLQSVYLQNDGNKKLIIKPLPVYAQMSEANGITETDFDKDGKKDIVLAGNFYPFRVSLGPLDAGIGLVLKGNGKGEFSPLPYSKTGLCIRGDVRNLMKIQGAKHTIFVAAKNNGQVQVVRLN